MAFDPFLYVAFGAGLAAGRLTRWRSPWVTRATIASVIVLVALLGASLSGVPVASLALTLPIALGFALLVLGLTAGVYLAILRFRPPVTAEPANAGAKDRFPLSLVLVAAVLVGYALGRFVSLPTATGITWTLYALLALVAFGLPFHWAAVRALWVPLTAAFAGAVIAGVVFALASGTALPLALATTFAFGFYSLVGPLVLARAGAVLALLAFLTNFFRENLTMILSPAIGRRLRGPGLTALGGATAMDTTLFFVTRYGDRDAGTLALASGLILTVVASLAVPLLLALPT